MSKDSEERTTLVNLATQNLASGELTHSILKRTRFLKDNQNLLTNHSHTNFRLPGLRHLNQFLMKIRSSIKSTVSDVRD